MSMVAGKESVETQSEEREGSAKISPSASTTQSSCVDQADAGEELDCPFHVKVKKERKIYTQFLLNQDKNSLEGTFRVGLACFTT